MAPADGLIFEDAQAINDQAGARWRQAQHLCLACCHEGSSVLCVSGRLFVVQKNQAILVAPGVAYALQSAPNNLAIWSFIDIDINAYLGSSIPQSAQLRPETLAGPHFPHVLDEKQHAQLVQAIQQLVIACRQGQAIADASQILRSLHSYLKRLPESVAPPLHQALRDAFSYALQHYRAFDEQTFFARSTLAPAEVERLLQAYCHCRLAELCQRIQVFHAAAALSQGATVSPTLASALGFTDEQVFLDLFLRYFAQTPQAWLAQQGS